MEAVMEAVAMTVGEVDEGRTQRLRDAKCEWLKAAPAVGVGNLGEEACVGYRDRSLRRVAFTPLKRATLVHRRVLAQLRPQLRKRR
jgi:hypothetical protein